MNEQLQAQLNDPEFAKLAAEMQTSFDDAQDFYHWDPDNGENTCILKSATATPTMDKDLGKNVLVVRAFVEIQTGDDAGEVFDLAGRWGWTPRGFTGLKTLASTLARKPIAPFEEALDTLYEYIGGGLIVSTSRSPSKKGGDDYVNHRIRGLVEVAMAPAE